jgi:Flp pilus assembly protein TadG
MSSFASAPKPAKDALGDERGEALISFALVLPLLVLMTLGLIEFTLAIFDYHRASEATRRGVRAAVISSGAVGTALSAGGTINCGASAGVSSCGTATGAVAVFTQVVSAMQAILPTIPANAVNIEYRDSGLGDASTPGGLIPVVTVRLVGFTRDFLLLKGIPGFGSGMTLPSFSASQVGGGIGGS